MAAENPALLHYFLQDDLYLLNEDKDTYNGRLVQPAATPPEAIAITETPLLITPPAQPVIETPNPDFKYLGNNKKQLLILVNYAADEHMAEAHLKALESTLGRKSLALDDVAIVNINRYVNNAFEDYISVFSPAKLLILGASALPTGLASPNLNVIETLPSRLQLYTHSFDEMLADREKAKAFWEQMKNF